MNTQIKSIEIHRKAYEFVDATCCAGMNLKGMAIKDLKRGTMIGPITNPPRKVKSFGAKLVVLDHPTKICKGYTPVLDTNTTHMPCILKEIVKVKKSKRHQHLMAELGEDCEFLASGDQAEVTFIPKMPLVIEALPDFPRYTRISLRDSGSVVAIGSCHGREYDTTMDKAQKAAIEKKKKLEKMA
ncbi:elongation factor 1-alpha, oocyte form-like [Octopus sinensis]|uniref:Elongation factor 1-alpha, oocyte form-like n=1 Tax=Octopus sinensis TaxID=2607531 RepID=A0A6P7TYX6_9MOLL|nr:elongation factor 1-alpha, oocyte form-like [Octopus sinensis]